MIVTRSDLSGVFVVISQPLADQRGFFTRLFCDKELNVFWGPRRIVQINQSLTKSVGAVRGLHFQFPPFAEMKLVRCLRGKAWDVVVDLRSGSDTFLKWHAEELTPDNGKMMVIPEGCAHGFQTLEDNCELLYMHTAHYSPEAEGGVPYNDPRLNIHWPLPVTNLSARDLRHQPIAHDFSGITV